MNYRSRYRERLFFALIQKQHEICWTLVPTIACSMLG